jgi:hypothetical protein
MLRLAGGPHLRRGGALLDHREIPADRGLADIERIGCAGLSIRGGVGLVEGVVELGMVRQEGRRAKSAAAFAIFFTDAM